VPWEVVGAVWNADNDLQHLTVGQVVALAFFDGNEAVGFLLAELYTDAPEVKGFGHAYTGSVDAALMAYVKPEWRDQGITSRLLRAIEPELISRLAVTESHLTMVIATGSLSRLASRCLRVLVSTPAPSNTTVWRRCLREYPRYHSMIERKRSLCDMGQKINKNNRCA